MKAPDHGQASDHELVRSFVSGGDADALEELIRRHQGRVYGLAYRILGNRADASDATQEVFILLLRKLRSFRQEAAFTTWLHRLTVNACYDFSRKRSRAPQPVEEVEVAQPEAIASVEARVVLQTVMSDLAVEHRTALVLREIYGLSYDEIASATGVPVGTVKSRIARGRAALADKLGAGKAGEPGRDAARLNEESQ